MRHARASGTRDRLKPTRIKVVVAAAGCLTLCLATGCRSAVTASGGIHIEQEIAPQPVRVGTATVTVRVSGLDGRPVTAARIALEADMSHPGMAPEFGEAREVAAGRYQGQLRLTMAGDWVIMMHITLAGGQKLERQMEVKGVRAK